MTWNYRVCKKQYKNPVYEEDEYNIREVYYNKDGSIWAISDGVAPYGSDLNEIKFALEKMTEALNKDVIDVDSIVFAPREIENS